MKHWYPIPGDWTYPTSAVYTVIAVQPAPTPTQLPPPTVPPATEGEPEMTWLFTILNLLPVIASGINLIHSDKTLETKQQIAQQALTLVVAGAGAVAPPSDLAAVSAIGQLASQTLNDTITALHNGTPALLATTSALIPPAPVATAAATA